MHAVPGHFLNRIENHTVLSDIFSAARRCCHADASTERLGRQRATEFGALWNGSHFGNTRFPRLTSVYSQTPQVRMETAHAPGGRSLSRKEFCMRMISLRGASLWLGFAILAGPASA